MLTLRPMHRPSIDNAMMVFDAYNFNQHRPFHGNVHDGFGTQEMLFGHWEIKINDNRVYHAHERSPAEWINDEINIGDSVAICYLAYSNERQTIELSVKTCYLAAQNYHIGLPQMNEYTWVVQNQEGYQFPMNEDNDLVMRHISALKSAFPFTDAGVHYIGDDYSNLDAYAIY